MLIQLKIMRVEGFSSGALLYWTWRITCTTSTYTFSNASRHGVRSLDPGQDNTPCMCNKRERGSREWQRLDDKCLWWRPHLQNNRQVCLSATVSAKCSIKTWNLFADKVIFHPSVSRDRWWLRGCVRKMKTDKIKKRKTKIEGGDLEGWRMH